MLDRIRIQRQLKPLWSLSHNTRRRLRRILYSRKIDSSDNNAIWMNAQDPKFPTAELWRRSSPPKFNIGRRVRIQVPFPVRIRVVPVSRHVLHGFLYKNYLQLPLHTLQSREPVPISPNTKIIRFYMN